MNLSTTNLNKQVSNLSLFKMNLNTTIAAKIIANSECSQLKSVENYLIKGNLES